MIGKSAQFFLPISRGVGPAGVGTSTSLVSSLSSTAVRKNGTISGPRNLPAQRQSNRPDNARTRWPELESHNPDCPQAGANIWDGQTVARVSCVFSSADVDFLIARRWLRGIARIGGLILQPLVFGFEFFDTLPEPLNFRNELEQLLEQLQQLFSGKFINLFGRQRYH
jgi:hypothetical protein